MYEQPLKNNDFSTILEANVRKNYEKQRFLDAAPGGPRRHPATAGDPRQQGQERRK